MNGQDGVLVPQGQGKLKSLVGSGVKLTEVNDIFLWINEQVTISGEIIMKIFTK